MLPRTHNSMLFLQNQLKYTTMKTTILIFRFLFLCLALNFSLTLSAQDMTQQADELVQAFVESDDFCGAVLLAKDGKIILKKGYGLANREWDIPNSPDTKFRLGSITKQFTGMLIMMLVADGKIELEAPMLTYLPDYRKDIGEKVTIHHLLTHTSGIPSYTDSEEFMMTKVRNHYDPDKFVVEFCSGDLLYEPGSQYAYNNSAYFILGLIIEKVTGMTYAEALEERIFKPLGMNDSGYDSYSEIIPKRATGYRVGENGYENAWFLDMSIPYAAGSLYSTVEDLYKWDRSLYTNQLLSEELKKKMFTPFLNNYAYGWSLGEHDGHPYMDHGGGIFGFNTYLIRGYEDDMFSVVLGNSETGISGRISQGLGILALGGEIDLPTANIPDEIEVDAASLEVYEGKYALNAHITVDVSLDGNDLMAKPTGQPAARLIPIAPHTFYVREIRSKLEFFKNDDGEIEHLVLHQNGEQVAKKIE